MVIIPRLHLVRKKDDQKIYAMKVIKKEGKVKGIKEIACLYSRRDIL
jgi:hypothetical protein